MSDFLQVRDYCKSFERNGDVLDVLTNISLSVEEGTVASIVGPSGCGKTTLMRSIAGLVPPSRGTITIDSRDPGRFRREVGIGFVFQRPLLFPWRTLKQNVLLPTELTPKRPGIEERYADVLDLVGLSEFDSFYPSELSGGMKQRTALARALMTDPGILLLDETFNAVDEITRERLWIDFRQIWESKGLTVLLVTHNIREAIFLSDAVYVMSPLPGQIRSKVDVTLQQDRSLDIVSDPSFIELYKRVRHYFI